MISTYTMKYYSPEGDSWDVITTATSANTTNNTTIYEGVTSSNAIPADHINSYTHSISIPDDFNSSSYTFTVPGIAYYRVQSIPYYYPTAAIKVNAYGIAYCDRCKYEHEIFAEYPEPKYCPNCGAKLVDNKEELKMPPADGTTITIET